LGYGFPAITTPPYGIPTFNPPGAPPAVRLVSSTGSSITVEWEFPRENGGSPVIGFQLFVDDWAGGAPRLAFDGIDQPHINSFVVGASTSFPLTANKGYKFMVRAVNYCFALNKQRACIGDFSDPAVFIARNPRAPLPPPMPYRHSGSSIGSQVAGDASITIRWPPAVDNGGSPLLGYNLYWAAPSKPYTLMNVSLPTVNDANGDRLLEYTVNHLNEGNVYRFYVVAYNKVGRSAASPILSVVAGSTAGVDFAGNHTYASSSPNVKSISSSAITVNWPMPASQSTGGIPVTGYKLFVYPGVGANTLASPRTVWNEVQVVQTFVDPMTSTIQQIFIPAGIQSFSLTAYGVTGLSNLNFFSSATTIAGYLNSLHIGLAANVSAWQPVGSTGKTFTVQFNGFDGNFEPLVITTTPRNLLDESSVAVVREGSSKINGSFTLSFNGSTTVDLPYNVSAQEMKYSLQDLPGIGIVTVVRSKNMISGLDRNAFSWTITFDSLAGDLPMLYPTPGRLEPLTSHVRISVTEVVKGTPALLALDGTGFPEVRIFTVENLAAGSTYAFSVLPLNALGLGVLSAPTQTVYATSGASSVFTTVNGSSLSVGITYDVDEQQMIEARNCQNQDITIYLGSKSVKVNIPSGTAAFEMALKQISDIDISVSHERTLIGATPIDYYRISFLNRGDVDLLRVTSVAPCNASVTEFVKGSRNEFTIQPKSSSGSVVQDTLATPGFEGKDLFLTETFFASNSSWYRDQGIATYNPQVYEVQTLTIRKVDTSLSQILSLNDYLTPFSTIEFNTTSFSGDSSSYDVQQAIQSLPNVERVDVEKINTATDVSFVITFLSNLGSVPLLTTHSAATVKEITRGVCEVQTITIASDDEFIREEKLFTVLSLSAPLRFHYSGATGNLTVVVSSISSSAIQSAIQQTFVDSEGVPLNVLVSNVGNTFKVEFISPVGSVGDLWIEGLQGGVYTPITVVENVRGVSPLSGTFTVYYEGEFTDDIDFNASPADIKTKLELLSGINSVLVYREDTNTGFKWTISFTNNVGNLRMMVASPVRYEVQEIQTTGGNPTPLSGQVLISFDHDSVYVNSDASEVEMTSALESMSSVGNVEVSRTTQANGQFTWLVTFRDLKGNSRNLGVSSDSLFGSNAAVTVREVIAGNAQTLLGPNPRLTVLEKEAGKPDYTAVYTVDVPGKYQTKVSQLSAGGLFGTYYENQWFYGSPAFSRIDPSINFDWSTGRVTTDASDFVSIRWTGKLAVSSSDLYTFYTTADDAVVIYLNHSVLINATQACCIEYKRSVFLTADVFYDVVIEYVELTGTASINWKYSSASIPKQVIPSNVLYSTRDIVGSPFETSVIPGGADYPFTTAFGDGLFTAAAGHPSQFFIQTKDNNGNNQTLDFEFYSPEELLEVTIVNGGTVYYAELVYLGGGLFSATYTPLKSGNYQIFVRMGDRDIYCGRGESSKCSPFSLYINPGQTVSLTSEIESPSTSSMDYLVEAVVGEFGTLYLQAKDSFGNNQDRGGDSFQAIFLSKSDPHVKFLGEIDDNQDGTYVVRYTINIAGFYDVSVTLQNSNAVDEPVLTCIAAKTPFVFDRRYDGVDAYAAPDFCLLRHPTLKVVHNQLSASQSTFDDSPNQQLAFATVGVPNSFVVEGRDIFGNLRIGDNTTHFNGYGNGKTDYFVAEFSQVESGDYVRVSSAVQSIVAHNIPAGQLGYFRLSFGGISTFDIPSNISSSGLEAVLESLHNFQLSVKVKKEIQHFGGSLDVVWTVEFLNMLDVWQSPSDGLRILPATNSAAFMWLYNLMHISYPASRGIYPVSFTLWNVGSYLVRITSNDIDIQGSPLTIEVSNADVDPSSSLAYGNGLTGGVAGVPLEVFIQAKDTRQTAVQYFMPIADIVDYSPEVQDMVITGATGSSTFTVSFRGVTSSTLTIGTSTVQSLLTALQNMKTMGNFTLSNREGQVITSTSSPSLSTVLSNAVAVQMTFSSLVGPLSLMSSSSRFVVISRYAVGDAPFRKPVQVLKCLQTTGAVDLLLDGHSATFNTATMTLSNLGLLLTAQLGKGSISISSPSLTSSSLVCGPSNFVFIQFDDVHGPVSTVTTSSVQVQVSTTGTDGALSGIFPLWGSFQISTHDESTPLLPFDASADAVQSALSNLYSVGNIHVTREDYGIAVLPDGVTPVYTSFNQKYIWSIWTVFFDSRCSGNFNGTASGNCPSSLGDEPLLSVSSSSLSFLRSPSTNQHEPYYSVVESLHGYAGNNRTNHMDIGRVSVGLEGRNNRGRIAMHSTQRLECQVTSSSGPREFNLQFLNNTVTVQASTHPTALENWINDFSIFTTLTVQIVATDVVVCADSTKYITINITSPSGRTIPLFTVASAQGVNARVLPVVQPVDSISKVEEISGLYKVVYTPTIAGVYDLSIKIDGLDLSTDLTAGVEVFPAMEYAPSSTHNASHVAIQGITEFFTVQLRDQFGNDLILPLQSTNLFEVNLHGVSDQCQTPKSSAIQVNILDNQPVTDGIYLFSYVPTVSGEYDLSVSVKTAGGLLATYFKMQDWTQPVLAGHHHLYDGFYHYPYWCDGLEYGKYSPFWSFDLSAFCDTSLENCGCDSTKLDSVLAFNWGNSSPLSNETVFGLNFPNDYFSVKWTGYIVSPEDGMYKLTVASDSGAKIVVNGSTLFESFPMQTSVSTFEVLLSSKYLSSIDIYYQHLQGASAFSLSWTGPGVSGPIGGDFLFHKREIINSPFQVNIYPGAVNATTSFATGSGLTDCTTLSDCSFIIQARDGADNNIYTSGSQSWNISLYGIGDWAGYNKILSQINDYNFSGVQHLNFSVVPLGWTFLGKASIDYGSRSLKFSGNIPNSLNRGDSVAFSGETFMVADSGVFRDNVLTLSRPYRGLDLTNYTVYQVTNCTTGQYLVSYQPSVRGKYQINLKTNAVDEIQQVYMTSFGNLGGNYTLTVSLVVEGQSVMYTSEQLTISNDPAAIESALASLPCIGSGHVNVDITIFSSHDFQFLITFVGLDQDVPPISVFPNLLVGNGLQVVVSEVQKGSPSKDLSNSPFLLNVVPNLTDAAFSTAFGPGLSYGVTGEVSTFSIQSKDSYGNNKLFTQTSDVYRLHAFLPSVSFDKMHSFVEGKVAVASFDAYPNWRDSRGWTCQDYSHRPVAVDGQCFGPECGCGDPANSNYLGEQSYGLDADSACCVCQSSCGGKYDVEFVPKLSGMYTLDVLLATQLEVQNISTSFSSFSSRAGYFTVSVGDCIVGRPCPTSRSISWDANGFALEEALRDLSIGDFSVDYLQTTDGKNFAWVVTFLTACDVPQLVVSSSTLPVSIRTVHQGACSMVGATNSSLTYPYANEELVEEVQLISLSCLLSNCQFQFSFRGYSTRELNFNASSLEIKAALESLKTIGSVDVDVTHVPLTHIATIVVSFRPTRGSTLAHLENYGPLPQIEIASNMINSTVTTVRPGFVPFRASVEALQVDAEMTTAVQDFNVAGKDGLHTGIYLDTTSFIIEQRDAYSNRVFEGPVAEVQIIETFTNPNISHATLDLKGSFTLVYNDFAVEVGAQAGIMEMKAALESLPNIGSVGVTTNSVKISSSLTAGVVYGSPIITIDNGNPSSVYQVGDW
jgi:hypothetical protein